MTRLNPVQLAALSYLERDWSVLPIGNDKRPLGSWRQWMKEPMSASEAEILFRHAPGVGIVCGGISGITVLDLDGEAGARAYRTLEQYVDASLTPAVRTGSGGLHLYFRHQAGQRVTPWSWHGERAGEVRGEGGYVVAPPSPHPNGNHYRWLVSPGSELPLMPREVGRLTGCLDLRQAQAVAEREAKELERDPHASAKAARRAEDERSRRYPPADRQYGTGRTPGADSLICTALTVARAGRNIAGFRLACQLRDAGYSQPEARDALLEFTRRAQEPGKHPYADCEALNSLRQAYARPPRNPHYRRDDPTGKLEQTMRSVVGSER